MKWALIVVFLDSGAVWDTGFRADEFKQCETTKAEIVEQYHATGTGSSGIYECVAFSSPESLIPKENLEAWSRKIGLKRAEEFYESGQLNEALKEYIRLGGDGDAIASFRAARMFELGEGVSGAELDKAVAWYQVAAREGHVGALKALANLFVEGRGVDRDVVQAWALLNIAVQKNDPEALAARDALAGNMSQREREAGLRRYRKLAPKYAATQ